MIVTIYRCGYCGNYAHSDGRVMSLEDCQKQAELIEAMTNPQVKEEPVHGECCLNEQHGKERVQITRDMAIDAGDPTLEGTWIDW